MKSNLNFLNYLLITVLLCIGFVSCDDDDNGDNNKKNVLTYGTMSYDIKGGYLEYYGEDESQNSFNFDLYLYTPGISADPSTGELTGNGGLLYAELWSNSATELTPGTYTFSSSHKAGTVSNLDIEDQDGNQMYFSSATIIVSKSGNNYTVDIIGKDSTGEILTANFSGSLKIYDSSDGFIDESENSSID